MITKPTFLTIPAVLILMGQTFIMEQYLQLRDLIFLLVTVDRWQCRARHKHLVLGLQHPTRLVTTHLHSSLLSLKHLLRPTHMLRVVRAKTEKSRTGKVEFETETQCILTSQRAQLLLDKIVGELTTSLSP